jgi:phosphoribosylglycinamide formyltransferase-1
MASHTGSNMQAIIDACKNGSLNAFPCVVISNNSDSIALEKAKTEGIPYYHLSLGNRPNFDDLDKEILNALTKHDVNLVILAGYMKKLGQRVLNYYTSRILNIHPALLPKYGGKGTIIIGIAVMIVTAMYGINVHKAVLEAKEKETGVTIHLVDNEYDTGRIINQCRVPVLENDTPETLSSRVLEKEHLFFIETLQKIVSGTIIL